MKKLKNSNNSDNQNNSDNLNNHSKNHNKKTHSKEEPKKDLKENSTKEQSTNEQSTKEQSSSSGVWKFFAAFGIILLLIVGITMWTRYSQVNDKAKNAYNGFDFTPAQGGLWVTRIDVRKQPYDIPFYFHPRDTESVLVGANVTWPITRNPAQVIISIDPTEPSKVVVGGVEIGRILGTKYNMYNIPTSSALSKPSATKVDIPVLSCANATYDRVVIEFKKGPENAIATNGNCVVLQYTDANESVRVADRYAYMLLRIMK